MRIGLKIAPNFYIDVSHSIFYNSFHVRFKIYDDAVFGINLKNDFKWKLTEFGMHG